MTQQVNLDEALELVKEGAKIDGKDGVLAHYMLNKNPKFFYIIKIIEEDVL